ncbi:MAG TPA: YciI-like protein [Candidatus Acidoferrum sp.]|nr:YciI-like protein [Candidatus Acidoferrum sp.]
MPYFALFYQKLVDGYPEKRAAYREEHLTLAKEFFSRGELVLAGALANPMDGALLIFRGPDASVVERFVARDPYVRNGLIKRWQIREWTVVVGNTPEPPAPAGKSS